MFTLIFFKKKIVVEMSASSPSQAKEQDDDTKPLWTYVTKIKSVGGGENYEIKFNICDVTWLNLEMMMNM